MKLKLYILLLILSYSGLLKSQVANGCTAAFDYHIRSEISPYTYYFMDQSTAQSDIVQWQWSFGNGQRSMLQNPEHQFLVEGIYVVTLRIMDRQGCTSIQSDTIAVTGQIVSTCNAFFTYLLDPALNPFSYRFFDHSIHTNDTIVSWTWDFGDFSGLSHAQNPIHQYSSTGTYLVQLTILTASGCSSSYQTNLVVSNGGVNCSASFTSSPDTVSSNPFDVVFHDNSLHQLPIQQWKWYFGDGDSSSYQDPTHQFPHAGIFPVRLVITTADCSSEIVIPIQVGNPQKYNLWGRVYVGNKTTDMCIAYLYKDFNNFIIPFDTVELTSVNDTLGVYYFYQVPEGNYKVHVELPTASQHAVSYAPTYYNSSLYWAQAQSIGVFQDLSLQNVDMTPLFAMVGTDYISGTVVGNGSKEHILVFLLNYQGEVVKYTHTDGNGDYQFTNVPQGDFLVQGECAGMASYPVNIQFTTAYDSLFNVDFHLVPGVLTGIYQSDKPIKNQSFKLFPNPILGSELTIQFDFMIDHDFEYTLYNAMGQKLKQGILASGKAAHRISLEGLIPGVYFMEVIGGDGRRIDVKRLIY